MTGEQCTLLHIYYKLLTIHLEQYANEYFYLKPIISSDELKIGVVSRFNKDDFNNDDVMSTYSLLHGGLDNAIMDIKNFTEHLIRVNEEHDRLLEKEAEEEAARINAMQAQYDAYHEVTKIGVIY